MAGVQATTRTFIAPPKGPGKTAPTFIEDLDLHDPAHPPPSGINLITEPCLNLVSVSFLGQILPPGSCRHAFITKDRQSLLPGLDERPGPQSVYKVAAVCKFCRMHVLLKVDYTIEWEERSCPNQDRPVHHLVHSPWQEQLARNQWASKNPQSGDKIYVFECSSKTCSATVHIQVSPPILDSEAVHTLVDKQLLKERTDEAFKTKAGAVEGMKYPTPMDVLTDLRTYLINSRTKEARPISVDNKRFTVRFGPEGLACKEVLESLRFKLTPHEFWEVPKPNPGDEEPLQDPHNIFLDNAEQELSHLILQRPSEERQVAQDRPPARQALMDFSRALGCQNYDKALFSRTAQIDPAMRPACYTALGIPQDAADSLIIFAYEQQAATDALRAPWYLSYLKEIQAMRPSEMLETKIAVELSEGKFDAAQLTEAYKYFGLSLQTYTGDDEHIIGVFQSRLQDARAHEIEMREQLRIIGVHRHSKKILDAAEDALNTYEQALEFLGVSTTTSDEFIATMFTTKASSLKMGSSATQTDNAKQTVDDTSLQDKALKAVKIIADHRKSKALHTWLDTGKMGDTSMDVAEAYSALGIDDRTAEDEMILSAYSVYTSDNPANVDFYNKALVAIAESKKSPSLQRFLGGQGILTGEGSAESPVGLENIGNTCYLNSLLQFFFSLPELRNIVLDFDKYKMDPTSVEMAKKKVGQRPVTVREVQTAQKFVGSLSNLFQEMIKSPQSSITPEQELARLTLETEDAKEKIKRRSTIASGGRPSLGHIHSMPIQGPLLPPPGSITGILSEEAVQSPLEADESVKPFGDGSESNAVNISEFIEARAEDNDIGTGGDNSSDITLVSHPSTGEDTPMTDAETRSQQQNILDNKENLLPPKALDQTRRSQSPDKHAAPLSDVSSSVLNSQAGVLALKPAQGDAQGEMEAEKIKPIAEPANKPPPIPPRPQHQQQQIAISKLEEYARQQDVTEVIAHCLFQFSCAMRPTGVDKTGDQVDEIHNLFYGQTRYHLVPEQPTQNGDDNFASIIARLYSKPHDIYAALDTYFDIEELENGSKRFTSMTQIPPIFAIQLDRVEFDNKTKSYRKSANHVEMIQRIFLDRYLEDTPDSPLMDRRKATWKMKQELSKMLARREELEAILEPQAQRRPDIPTVFEDAKSILESLQNIIPDDEEDEPVEPLPETIETLNTLVEISRSELEDIQTRSRDLQTSINSDFTDLRKHPYRLHAAFFHRGTQGSGHYWVYIFDFKQEVWRKYNDGYVTKVEDTTEIFGRPSEAELKTYSGPANPYFLVYVKEGEESRLTESVHRDIVYPPPSEPPPVRSQMTEFPPQKMDFEMEMMEMKTQREAKTNKRFEIDVNDDEGPNPMLEPLL